MSSARASRVILALALFAIPSALCAKGEKELWKRLGDEYLEKKDYDNAIQRYRWLVDEDKKEGWSWASLAFGYYKKGDYAQTVDAMNSALEAGPKRSLGQKTAGLFGIGKDDRRTEEQRFKAWVYKVRGDSLVRLNRLQEARSDLQQAYVFANAADEPYPLNRLGDVAVELKDYADARARWTKSLEREANQAWPTAGLGLVSVLLDEPLGAAMERFRAALSVDGSFAAEKGWTAYLHLTDARGRWEDGLLLVDEILLKANARNADYWNSRGVCRERLGNLKSAAADFQEALRLQPANELAAKNLRIVEDRLAAAAREERERREREERARAPAPPAQTEPQPDPAPAAVRDPVPSPDPAPAPQPPAQPPERDAGKPWTSPWEAFVKIAPTGLTAFSCVLLLAAFVRRMGPGGAVPAGRARSFELSNPGAARVELGIAATVPWLSVAPARLALEPGARGRVEVRLSGPAPAGAADAAVRVQGAGRLLAEIGVRIADGQESHGAHPDFAVLAVRDLGDRAWKLHEAASFGRVDVVRRLLAEGVDPNAWQDTCLPGWKQFPRHTALNHAVNPWSMIPAHVEIVKLLLAAGARVRRDHFDDLFNPEAEHSPESPMPTEIQTLLERYSPDDGRKT